MGRELLVAYASKHGSTHEVAEAVAEQLRQHGHEVDVLPAGSVDDVERYEGVVVGGALYMGRWHGDASRFLRRHGEALEATPVAVFAMGPLTMKEADVAGARKQLDRALAKAPIEPVAVTVFGGMVDPTRLRFPFSRMPATDARDWDAIRAWADEIAQLIGRVAMLHLV
jgi:menaquinone-dependent protoporphyrinogen oxidase